MDSSSSGGVLGSDCTTTVSPTTLMTSPMGTMASSAPMGGGGGGAGRCSAGISFFVRGGSAWQASSSRSRSTPFLMTSSHRGMFAMSNSSTSSSLLSDHSLESSPSRMIAG